MCCTFTCVTIQTTAWVKLLRPDVAMKAIIATLKWDLAQTHLQKGSCKVCIIILQEQLRMPSAHTLELAQQNS